MRRERSTVRSGRVRGSPRRTAQPEKGRAAPTFEIDRATDALQALATERVRGKLAISVR
jgi:hypothetical protein